MKKTIALLMVLALCLSLCACGGGNNVPETIETPTTTEPQYEIVEITMDNWQEYFEFVFIEDLIYKKNYTIDHTGKQCKIKDE